MFWSKHREIVFLCSWNSWWSISAVPQQPNNPVDSFESKKRQFTYSDVLRITNNFQTKVLGRGGFGKVYHGYVDDTQVAVKMLSPTSGQGYQQFQAEACTLRTHG